MALIKQIPFIEYGDLDLSKVSRISSVYDRVLDVVSFREKTPPIEIKEFFFKTVVGEEFLESKPFKTQAEADSSRTAFIAAVDAALIVGGGGVSSIGDLVDVIDITATGNKPIIGDILEWDGSQFITASNDGVSLIAFSAGRNAVATNLYLRDGDGTPTNQSPFIMPFDGTLIAISASTNVVETWVAEIHSGLSLITGATLTLTAVTSAFRNDLLINVDAGDPIELFCNGTSIDRPRIYVVFKRR